MREIKFRGKVEGNWWYVTPADDAWEQFWALVDKKTISQHTGLKDCNGKEIYESDICRAKRIVFHKGKMVPGIYTIYWRDDRWHLKDQNGNDYECGDYYQSDEISWQDVEVIGNLYDNPELTNKSEENYNHGNS